MTYWADNIKFIKDIQDSKYKKIEDSIEELDAQIEILNGEKDNKKAREHFLEAARTIELMDPKEMQSLGDTMFQDMNDSPEKTREIERLQEMLGKYESVKEKIKSARSKFGIN